MLVVSIRVMHGDDDGLRDQEEVHAHSPVAADWSSGRQTGRCFSRHWLAGSSILRGGLPRNQNRRAAAFLVLAAKTHLMEWVGGHLEHLGCRIRSCWYWQIREMLPRMSVASEGSFHSPTQESRPSASRLLGLTVESVADPRFDSCR